MAGTRIAQMFLRTLQFIFATIVLALAAALVAQQVRGGSPARINYSVYIATFALLSLLYLFPAAIISSIHSPVAATILDALNTIFFFCAGIALASSLHGNSCNNRNFLVHNGITNGGGSTSMKHRCREANALTAFEWFAFGAFLCSLLVSVYQMSKSDTTSRLGRRSANMAGTQPQQQQRPMGQV